MGDTAMGLLDSVGGFVRDAGDSIAHAAGTAANVAGDAFNTAVDEAKSAAHAVGNVVREADAIKDKVGTWIDQKEQQLEHKVDEGRAWLREHGGVAGKMASDQIGLVEGVGTSLYGAGKGIVQLADGVSSLANPLEWAANPDANIARLKSGAQAVETMGKIANLAQPTAWMADPKGNAQLAGALWHSASTSFNQDPSKFIGNAVGTVGMFFIPGGGEAAVAGDVGKAAALTGDIGKVAAVTSDVGKVAAVTGDVGKAAAVTEDVGRAATITEDAGKAAAVAEDTGKAASATADASKADVFESRTSMGNIEPPRTPGLGERAALSELVEQGAIPGAKGVILTGVGDPAAIYGDVFKLSQRNGIEYALTREGDNLVLRSGSANKVAVPSHAEPLAHTHPFDPLTEQPQKLPSRADINVLNDRWNRAPDGPRPSSDIIWGSEPGQVTRYHATGLDPIPDPTKGGLKPGRTWQ